ncbi:putative integral membrane protein [Theileria parva strain Muguga]|uniref:Uncharacterized protein n=1 Tax=Theileria parva TaxID=5875 RepID=Q4MYU2_THEPA|nr:putative integral membrane protein [Theileria parva strain Muguga]EAN30590.1 putative integral membrane protein [Theileria parva strain Muguga]|eukprot:XP_762873.1 hypothetical protein [Theileria parva strain Muguga]
MKRRYLCNCDKSKCCSSDGNNNCTCCNGDKVKCCLCPSSKSECKCSCKSGNTCNELCCRGQSHSGNNCVCCRCCCSCFCKKSHDEYYFYFITMIFYISQLFEDVFTFDNEKIRMAIQFISSLVFYYDPFNFSKNSFSSKRTFINYYRLVLNPKSDPITKIESGTILKLINGQIVFFFRFSEITINLNSELFKKVFQIISELIFFIIKGGFISTKVDGNIVGILIRLSNKYILILFNEELKQTQQALNCHTDNNKCNCSRCKIFWSSLYLFSIKYNSIASLLQNLGIIISLNIGLGKVNIYYNEFLIRFTKNSRISESTHGLLYERNGNFDHINPKYFGYDDVYRPSPQFGSGYFKFVITRVFTVIVLVVLFIFIRTRFDRFVNTDIFGRYLIKVDSNIGRLREVLHNRLSHSVRNISRMGSLDDLLGDMTEGDVGHNLVFHHPERYQDVIDNMGMADMGHYDAMSDIDTLSDTFTDASFDGSTKAVQESRRRKVGFYILIIVFSLLSALYLNFVVRDLSVMLQLDHTTWSYFISITVLMGMIISLVVKYCVHLYDFVYVLENYSNKLTKIESFVDDSFGGVTGNLTYTSKFVLLFQLLRSMKTDLVSLFSMNYPYQIPAHSLMKNKVYPYKDMTGGMERMMTCENIECIRKMVLESIGTPESMDLQNVLDFVSYVTVRNTAEFDQYRGYFSGFERYLAWRLGKLLGHNFFLLTYGRYSCMLEMDHRIRKLRIPSTQFLNCQFLWQLFGNYESDLISLKCLGEDSIGIPLTHVQKDVLKNKFADEYLDEFKKYQEFLIRKLHIKASKCYDSPSCYFPYPELINTTLDRDKVSRLTREYFGDSSRRLSLSLPTTNCDVTNKIVNGKGAESPGVSVTQFCDHWLYMRLGCCETEDCEKGVRFAHDLIMSKLNCESHVFESIKDTVASLKLSILNTEETYETPEDIHVPVKSSEHRSLKDYTDKLTEFRYQTSDNYQDTVLDYLNRYMIETVTNREKIMVPLGIFLTWYGIPVCEQHLRNMGKFQYLI